MYAEINGLKFYYELWRHQKEVAVPDPSSPLLLLVHGGPGGDHNYFKPEFVEFSQHMTVGLYDQRGHGNSKNDSRSGWSLDMWAKDLSDLIAHLNHPQTYVLGNSFGGMVAQRFAMQSSHQIRGLILSSTMLRLRTERITKAFNDLYGKRYADVAKEFWRDPRVLSAREAYRKICGPLYNTQHTPHPPMNRNDAVLETFYGIGGEGRRFDFSNELSSVATPTLIIGGGKDPISTPQDSHEIFNALQGAKAEMLIFGNCGHGPHRDNPDRVLSAIRSFVEKNKGPSFDVC